jgi:hypothetical protein
VYSPDSRKDYWEQYELKHIPEDYLTTDLIGYQVSMRDGNFFPTYCINPLLALKQGDELSFVQRSLKLMNVDRPNVLLKKQLTTAFYFDCYDHALSTQAKWEARGVPFKITDQKKPG